MNVALPSIAQDMQLTESALSWIPNAYLLMFGFGTVLGMMIVTAILALPALYAGNRMRTMRVSIQVAAGALSIVFGVLLARELIVDGGLFSAAPTWEPH